MGNPRTRQLCWVVLLAASNILTAVIVASLIHSSYVSCPVIPCGSMGPVGAVDDHSTSAESTELVPVSCLSVGGGPSATPFKALLNPADATVCRCATPPISQETITEHKAPPTAKPAAVSSSLRNVEADENLPVLFIITPTYSRPTQKVDLTSLCQTLSLVPQVLWIVVEDSEQKTELVARLLGRCAVKHAHLNIRTPEMYRPKPGKSALTRNRGVEQRNMGLQYVRQTTTLDSSRGVVYFGDDDNKYDIRLFEEIRKTKVASVLPVAFAGGLKVEGPVCENGKAVKWHASWGRERTFPVDMAGLAVNARVFLERPSIELGVTAQGGQAKLGYLETELLNQFTSRESIECRGSPDEVYVWHTKTEKPNFVNEKYYPSDPKIEYR